MPTRKAVFEIINSERNSQDQQLPADPFELFDWLNFIDDHLLRARTSATKVEATDELRNLAACAVAAMEQYGVRLRTGEFGINQPTNMSKLSGMLSDLDESQFSHQGVAANIDSVDDEDDD
tara:strand:- start:105 stop:467 length:363 start_codon:yes stop_codon:yes gene_type:complete